MRSMMLVAALLLVATAGAGAAVKTLGTERVATVVAQPVEQRSAADKEYCGPNDRSAGKKQYGGCGCGRSAGANEYGCPPCKADDRSAGKKEYGCGCGNSGRNAGSKQYGGCPDNAGPKPKKD